MVLFEELESGASVATKACSLICFGNRVHFLKRSRLASSRASPEQMGATLRPSCIHKGPEATPHSREVGVRRVGF